MRFNVMALLALGLIAGCTDSTEPTLGQEESSESQDSTASKADFFDAIRDLEEWDAQRKIAEEESQFRLQLPNSAWPSLIEDPYRGPSDLQPITSPGPSEQTRPRPVESVRERLEAELASQGSSAEFLLAVGVAQYRCDAFKEAIKTLSEFDKEVTGEIESLRPVGFAVQAMSHYRLDQICEATDLITRAREILDASSDEIDEKSVIFVDEAEELIIYQMPNEIRRPLERIIQEVTGNSQDRE